MRRMAAVGSMGLILACAVAVGQDDVPPLSAPIDALPPVEAPKPEPAEPPPAESRPILAVPGLPRAKPRPKVAKAKAAAPAAVKPSIPKLEPIEPADDGPPPLSGPAGASPSPADAALAPPSETGDPVFSDATPPSGDGPPPLTLESVPADSPAVRPSGRAGTGSAAAPDREDKIRPVPRAKPPARRPGLLGGIFGGPRGAERAERQPGRDSGIDVESRSDPAADATLKRRVERQIRETAPDHLRSAEVMVIDRSVTIRARVDRPWHRRAVRRRLESLPGLDGYKARVEIVE